MVRFPTLNKYAFCMIAAGSFRDCSLDCDFFVGYATTVFALVALLRQFFTSMTVWLPFLNAAQTQGPFSTLGFFFVKVC